MLRKLANSILYLRKLCHNYVIKRYIIEKIKIMHQHKIDVIIL